MSKLIRNPLVTGILWTTLAMAAPVDRIQGSIGASRSFVLPGHIRTLSASYVDQGPIPASQHLDGLILFFKPSALQRNDLGQLLIQLHDPASAIYHQWLTPEDYADRFGVSPSDAGKIANWLEAQGFHVGRLGRARSFIVFDGPAGAVESAFRAGIHRYRSADSVHYVNSQDPSVPQALQDIVGRIGGLDDFLPVPDQHATPDATSSNGTHTLAPGDLATIYDFASLLSRGIDGTGQTLVVVGESNILKSDLQAYRAKYNMAAPNVQVVLVPNFPDPGVVTANSLLLEADIDTELAGAVARNATILFVYSTNAYNALNYAIDQNLAPVVSVSFHFGCDASVSASEMSSYQLLAQQANAQGITWVNSSGDIGAAGCDSNGETAATMGLATRFPGDIPEVTAVGGTHFNDQSGNYWSSTNDSFGASALSYIPESVWNDTSTVIAASSGGVSTFFFKPPWQTGPGVPADGHRDTPDVAVAASNHTPYPIFTNGSPANGGATSGAAPVFAGMVVLLNQYLVANGGQSKPGLGNLNVLLYRIAQSNPAAFHDVTSGNNIVPCIAGSPDCVNGQLGYTAGPGFDLCTGLGSVDLAELASAALTKPAAASLIVVSSNANPVYQQAPDFDGYSWSVTLTLTEEAGIATTLTGFSIDGKSETLATWFSTAAISPFGSAQTSIEFMDLVLPRNHVFAFTGADKNGRTWTTQVSIPFVGFAPSSTAPVPSIQGATNSASFAQVYAPGMIMAIFASQLSTGTESTPTIPLPTYLKNFEATVNGVLTPIYYVSPTFANVQIPYGTAPGPATLVVYQGGQSASTQIQIAAAAPGIFTDSNGNLVPAGSGVANQILPLYITGDGEVSPSLATGATPASTVPLANLPKSILPVSVTIGGQPSDIKFDGITWGLVGATQINFTVPTGLAPGPQPVVVTVGGVPSNTAIFTITH